MCLLGGSRSRGWTCPLGCPLWLPPTSVISGATASKPPSSMYLPWESVSDASSHQGVNDPQGALVPSWGAAASPCSAPQVVGRGGCLCAASWALGLWFPAGFPVGGTRGSEGEQVGVYLPASLQGAPSLPDGKRRAPGPSYPWAFLPLPVPLRGAPCETPMLLSSGVSAVSNGKD